jgi:diaminohydroxyphosphoribosylaminopyrimidine deaminase / 5-amino-6-(5-phosphoribosylamino)uracil reductase
VPSDVAIDRLHLTRAIDLAERGRGSVSPNPLVGAVLSRREEVIGEGFHRAVGGPHAEVEAIQDAAEADLTDATLYISIEPCCHRGRTPPCTEAILEAGIHRVVVAADDPSEHASGRGLGILRDEGVEVVVADGDLAWRARLQNQPFRKHARTGRPLVVFKSAMTIDGKVATRTGDSKWISGEQSRELVHRWRAECDAVAVGIGTVLVDDPRLTARIPEVSSQPRRIVFDSMARLPLASQLVRDSRQDPLTVVVSRAAPRTATDALRAQGVEVLVATGENEPARVRSALDQLGAASITSLLLEGGPHLAGAFFDAREIDEVRLFMAPLLAGGKAARTSVEGEGTEAIGEAMRTHGLECHRIQDDLLVSARIREW